MLRAASRDFAFFLNKTPCPRLDHRYFKIPRISSPSLNVIFHPPTLPPTPKPTSSPVQTLRLSPPSRRRSSSTQRRSCCQRYDMTYTCFFAPFAPLVVLPRRAVRLVVRRAGKGRVGLSAEPRELGFGGPACLCLPLPASRVKFFGEAPHAAIRPHPRPLQPLDWDTRATLPDPSALTKPYILPLRIEACGSFRRPPPTFSPPRLVRTQPRAHNAGAAASIAVAGPG